MRAARMDEVRRIEALAKRLAKLEAAKTAEDDPIALALKAIDGKTKGRLPSEFYVVDRRPGPWGIRPAARAPQSGTAVSGERPHDCRARHE